MALGRGAGLGYGMYFYDVTTGNNQADPSIPGYPATTGWDPVTGLGTPNAVALVPALAPPSPMPSRTLTVSYARAHEYGKAAITTRPDRRHCALYLISGRRRCRRYRAVVASHHSTLRT
jgi:hypothetical protein